MSRPSLLDVEEALERIGVMAATAAELAPYLWPLGYARPRAASVSAAGGDVRRPVEAVVGNAPWTDREGTGHAGSPEWVIRAETTNAGVAILRAEAALGEARLALGRAAAMARRSVPSGPAVPDGPPLVGRDELKAARAALRKRRAARPRGVGHGEY